MSANTILARTAMGAGWVIGWRLSTRLLGFANTLTLARLLSPADFGLVALGATFAMAVDTLSTLGIEEAIIREKTADKALYDTGFTINALRGLATTVVIAAAALPMSWFFHEPRLANVLFALAAGTFVTAFESIGIVEFRRDIDFRREFLLLIVPRVAAICTSIGCALLLRSYWALIAGILMTYGLRVALGYRMHPYRPGFSLAAWDRLAGFSFWTWVMSVVSLARDRSDALIIGRVATPADVGVYGLGSEIALLPTTELVAPLARACYSGFNAARHGGVDVGAAYVRIVGAVSLLALPAGLGVSLLGDPIVRLSFGDQWAGAAIVVQILGAFGTFAVLGSLSSTLLSAHGHLRHMAVIQLGTGLLRIGLVLGLLRVLGFAGAATGVGVAMLIESILFLGLIIARFGVRPLRLMQCCWRAVAATALMAAALVHWGIGWAPVSATPGRVAGLLAEQSALGAAVYALALLLLWTAQGRPAGPEADMLSLLDRLAGRLRGRRKALT